MENDTSTLTFDEVMERITEGLSGDTEKDREYLSRQMEEYKQHKHSKEIMRAILRMLVEIAPNALKKKFAETAEKMLLGVEDVVEEARFQFYKRDFKKALKIMDPLIKKIDEKRAAGIYVDDDATEYRDFFSPIERSLYEEIYKPRKKVQECGERLADAYLCYGAILVEVQKYTEARLALEKALSYNPVSAAILFELADMYKIKGDNEEFLRLTKQCFECAYSSEMLSRCYNNLGLYYSEKDENTIAAALFYMSLDYVPGDKVAQSELFYITEKTGQKVPTLRSDEIIAALKKYGIQTGADDRVVRIAYSLGTKYKEENDLAAAKYFFDICYDLTEGEDVKAILDAIDEELA